MVAGILDGRIEATTKAGEHWFSRVDSPTAFWVTLGVHFIVGLGFLLLGFALLREKNPPH